ncbi:hypothetical protein [Neoroseomonas lacus]|uniref:Uncharacterized protein n=1 Tax=Neoroseomonas lacus TaxID=287609 RepID=A0A917NRS1_9PROT|nr:hypothetical protein [Neoroseomonas lacus]GGJ21827.1 hypothetical protein GCM10011320_31320 [Neoroseomonas lacus]
MADGTQLPSDLITVLPPPPNRVGKCTGGAEHHLSEGAVMLAFAFYLFRTEPRLGHVAMHPDGEHGKRFPFLDRMGARGFKLTKPMGSTDYGGLYGAADGRSALINPKPGMGDVIADLGDASFVAECKGGIINTTHPGQTSRLRSGLCEAIGQCLATPMRNGQRQFAVVPHTRTTMALAQRMQERAAAAGIEIALVDGSGEVTIVGG